MVKKCFRCGKCCDSYFGIVPKTITDNLSPHYLEKKFLKDMKFKEFEDYIENHSELMGHSCKWLRYRKNGLAYCMVYKNRSSDCRNYPEGYGDCRVGLYLKTHKN